MGLITLCVGLLQISEILHLFISWYFKDLRATDEIYHPRSACKWKQNPFVDKGLLTPWPIPTWKWPYMWALFTKAYRRGPNTPQCIGAIIEGWPQNIVHQALQIWCSEQKTRMTSEQLHIRSAWSEYSSSLLAHQGLPQPDPTGCSGDLLRWRRLSNGASHR